MNMKMEYTRRLEGIISSAFRKKTVFFGGVGAGSFMAEKFARLMPAGVKLCDFDKVEFSGLSRANFTHEDAVHRKLKVDALAGRVVAANPFVTVTSIPKSILELDEIAIAEVFAGVDLIVAGTDQLHAQARLNEIAVRLQIPAVFVGIHAFGQGGRLIWYVPGMPCYRCVARDRFQTSSDGADLVGAVGALFDCQFIDMLATKVAVAILERDQDSTMGAFFRAMRGRNEIVVRCSPDYEWGNQLWNALLSDLPTSPKGYARELQDYVLCMDSVWLKTDFDPSCPVCKGAAQ